MDNTNFLEVVIQYSKVVFFGGGKGNSIIDKVLNILSGGGAIAWFTAITSTILVALIVVEVYKWVLDLLSGESGKKINRKVFVFFSIIFILMGYKNLAIELYEANHTVAKMIYEDFNSMTSEIEGIATRLKNERELKKYGDDPALAKWTKRYVGKGINVLGTNDMYKGRFLSNLPTLTEIIVFLFVKISKIIIYVKLAGAFISYGFVLVLGPFFIPFFISSDFRSMAQQWLTNIFVYFLEVQIMLFTVYLANTLVGHGFHVHVDGKSGFLSMDTLWSLIIYPAFAVGVLFAVSRMARTIFSSILGGAEDSVLPAVGGGIGMAVRGGVGIAGLMFAGGMAGKNFVQGQFNKAKQELKDLKSKEVTHSLSNKRSTLGKNRWRK